jgi:hypothetical protein
VRFNIYWDRSVNAAPAAFKSDVLAVANFYASTFTDPVTVNIAVGYGEVNNQRLLSGALGESLTYLTKTSYSQLTSALQADASTTADVTAVGTLPATDPTGTGNYWLTTANAKALGLYAGIGLDGYVGFSSSAHYTYDASHGVAAGTYDFFGVVAHEFSEVMGRQMLTGGTLGGLTPSYTALDLFHYAGAGVRALTGTTPGYFSIDGGATPLHSFNTNPGGDFGDWASSGGADAFNAYSSSGVVNKISAADLTALDVIGWGQGATTTSSFPTGTQAHLGAAHADVVAHDAGESLAQFSVGHGLYDANLVGDLSTFYGV